MGLSARWIEGYPINTPSGSTIVILDVTGEGMLRTLGLGFSEGYCNVKIELDDIVIYDNATSKLYADGVTSSNHGGFGVTIRNGASTMLNKRLLNLPFNTRLKITLKNIHSGAWSNSFSYTADYLIDVK